MQQALLNDKTSYPRYKGSDNPEEETLESEILTFPQNEDSAWASSRYHQNGDLTSSGKVNMYRPVQASNTFRRVPGCRVNLNRGVVLLTIGCLAVMWMLTALDEDKGSSTISQVASIFLPFVVYLGNAAVCYYFFTEAITMRTEGYLNFFEIISTIVSQNFGITSVFFVFIFTFYCFVLHDEDTKRHLPAYTRSWIVLVLWTIGFGIILGMLINIARFVRDHNKKKEAPEFARGNKDGMATNEISVTRAIPSFHGIPSNNAEKVIENLYNERQALMKQMNNINQELLKLSKQQGTKSSDEKDGNADSNSSSASTSLLQKKIRELEDVARTDRQTINNLKAEIDTRKTMFDAKVTECDQQRSILQTQQAKIDSLMAEKEKIDRDMSEYQEQIQQLQTMVEVKDEELANAAKELQRGQRQKRKNGDPNSQ